MTRETLIVLIEKELNELQTLTKGFSEMTEFPKSLLSLAIAKADNVRTCLEQLPNAERPAVKMTVAEAAPVTEVVEQKTEIKITAEIPNIVESAVEIPTLDVVEVLEEEVSSVMSVTTEHTTRHTVAETIQKPTTVSDSLLKSDDSLGSTIAKQPIHDIKQAISIADRFRFQRELFDGNGEKMNHVLSDLNELDTLEKAQTYLAKNFAWTADDANVVDFMLLLQRRYSN